MWLRPVRCSTDDKSGSVNRLNLEGGGPDNSPIRLYIHPMSFPITLQLLFACVLTLICTERRMTFTQIKAHARILLYKQTNIFFSPLNTRMPLKQYTQQNASNSSINAEFWLFFYTYASPFFFFGHCFHTKRTRMMHQIVLLVKIRNFLR